MKQFIETIRILNGKPQHLRWHQQRVDATLKSFYPDHPHTWDLKRCLKVPEDLDEGIVKCRILYDAHHFEVHYSRYTSRPVRSLKVVQASESFDYRYKYADRDVIDQLQQKREEADDILIIREGWVTDTSIANIAFEMNQRWYTPSMPLLAGTTWKRLISERILFPRPINLRELSNFRCFKVFNAMNEFGLAECMPVKNIR